MPGDFARTLTVAAILSLAILPGASQVPSLRILSATPAGRSDRARRRRPDPHRLFGADGGSRQRVFRRRAVMDSHHARRDRQLLLVGYEDTHLLAGPLGAVAVATRVTVRVDSSTTSVAGHSLGAPYEYTFTTPTVRLLSAEWYRQTGRFDSPAVIALRFNQPVRPEDAVAHAHVALMPHAWNAPVVTAEIRERWRQTDPEGLARFDEKIAAVKRVTSIPDPIGARLARSWNEKRFPPEPTRVVLETTTAPPPEGWLAITIDDTMPSPEGRETRPAHSAVVRLDSAFFVAGTRCTVWCDATDYNPILLTQPVEPGALRSALAVADVTDGTTESSGVPGAKPPR